MAAASRGRSRHNVWRRESLGRPLVATVLATISHVLAPVPDVFSPIPNIFAPVADVFTRITAIFDSVATATIVPRIPQVFAPVTDILSPVAHILTSVADVFPAVADVLAAIPHVLSAVADDVWQRTNVMGLTLGLRNGRSASQQGRGSSGQSEFAHRILQSFVSRARRHGVRCWYDAGDLEVVKRSILPPPLLRLVSNLFVIYS